MATVIGPEQAPVQNVNNPIFLIVNKLLLALAAYSYRTELQGEKK